VEGLSFFSADFPPADKTTKKTMTEELKKLLAALFGVADTATEEEILAAGKTYVENQAKKDAATPDVTALSVGMQDLIKRLDGQERDAIIAQAVKDGKLVPNSAKGLPVAQLKAIVDELTPNQVPLDQRTPEGVQALSASLSAGDLAVCQQLGLTPEEFAKTK
jgi:phage I-like protein